MSDGDLLDQLLNPESDRAWRVAVGHTLREVREQTMRTNGRVSRLERFIWALGGGLIVCGAIVVPLFLEAVQR
ncbi:MAG: hypothetical protein KatS3mg064_0584 [Tepidiforma sp.]|nr:hypothetical protein [Tepidiforma sp.]GIW17427.1 MAG: hypothetical protein KatS3mg064_0584 [Tepidiforma sp.]